MNELKQEFLLRSVTAIFITAVVVTLVFFPPDWVLKIFIALLSFAIFSEWMTVSESSLRKKSIFQILFISFIGSVQFIGALFEPISFTTMLGITIWIIITYQIFFKEGRLSSYFRFSNFWIGLILTATFCLICFQFVSESKILLIVVIFNVAVFDTGAYVIGKNFGKNLLLPELSPNKTVEGLIGGTLSSIVFITFLFFFLEEVSLRASLALVFSLPFALCGDYFFSFLKRKAKVKDTGSILPGHGGLIDRVDSHLAAIPMTAFFSLLLDTTGSYF